MDNKEYREQLKKLAVGSWALEQNKSQSAES